MSKLIFYFKSEISGS